MDNGIGRAFPALEQGEIENAPLEKALKHPNWSMGKKITIDSASLANKGLEVMEAHYMFKAPADMIKVVIQPKSVVHAMVEKSDSSVVAQMSPVDMRLPLQKAMLFPKMCKFTVNKPLDFWKIGTIEFIEPDMHRFPCLKLAYDAIGSDTTAVYNIANEMAVDLYISGRINFGTISRIISESMERFSAERPADVAGILALDGVVRSYIEERY
jgi:1-deoxy-D-xylulose-5-phosphate reductoisomerase